MGLLIPPSLLSAISTTGAPPFRGTMTPRGEPDPDGAADYPRFDNEHGAAVREILQTTNEYVAAVEKAHPLFVIDVDFAELPTAMPPAGSGKFWNNNGVICVA